MNSNCSNLKDLRNLQEQVKKAFCYQKLFWPFTVRTTYFSDLKIFANSRPSASNFKFFSWSLEQFFLTVGQNNFGNKIPLNYLLANSSTCYCCDIRIVINVCWFIKLIFWFKVIWSIIAVAQIQNKKGCLFKAVHFQTDSKTLRLTAYI